MRKQPERDLLVDIAKLLKDYGPETFQSLAQSISSPEMIENLSTILTQAAKIARTIPKTNRKRFKTQTPSIPRSLIVLKTVDPEKCKLLTDFYNDLNTRKVLHSLRDIKQFAIDSGLREVRAKSRQNAVSPLITSLIAFPTEKLKARMESLKKYDPRDRGLEGWSTIILDRQKRLG